MPDSTGNDDADSGTRLTVALPSLGADMDVGRVIEWRVAVGDSVSRGDIVAVVSTEKSDIDVETWDGGVVAELVAPMNEEIPVGAPLLILEQDEADLDGREPTPTPGVAAPTPIAQPDPAPDVRPTPTQRATPRPTGGVLASPLARRLAPERGISLSELAGSGPHGEILASDIIRPGDTDTEAPEPGTRRPEADPSPPPRPIAGDGMRAAIADRMSRSNEEIPHYHLERDLDLSTTMAWLAAHNEELPLSERVVPAALVACAAARAAREVPQLNGSWADGAFVPGGSVDLGIVVSLRRGGLVVTTVPDADELGPDDMMTTMRDMVTGARKGQLRSRWMSQPTITITNLGDNGADRVSGIIFPPQVALVGFGRISERPWCEDGTIVARPVATASLAGDHRATDGADGSRFLAAFAQALADPAALVSNR